MLRCKSSIATDIYLFFFVKDQKYISCFGLRKDKGNILICSIIINQKFPKCWTHFPKAETIDHFNSSFISLIIDTIIDGDIFRPDFQFVSGIPFLILTFLWIFSSTLSKLITWKCDAMFFVIFHEVLLNYMNIY